MKRLLSLEEEKGLSKVVDAVLDLAAKHYKQPHEKTAEMQVVEEIKLQKKKDKVRNIVMSEAMRYIEDYNRIPVKEELLSMVKNVINIDRRESD